MKTTRTLRAFLLAAVVALTFSFWGINSPAFSAETGTSVSAALANPLAAPMEGAAAAGQDGHGHHVFPKILLNLLIILVLAKIGGDLFQRIGQPAVLGELIFGIILGNLSLLHLSGLDGFVKSTLLDPEAATFVTLLSEIGVMLLLFEVGLESTVGEMMSVGVSSLLVAMLGVIAPMALGFGVGRIFLPDAPWTVPMFIGAVLAATSVGITARVLRDLGQMHRRESKIILGAAVIDDVLGLIVVAVAQGMVLASNSGKALEISSVAVTIGKAIAFFVLAVLVGRLVARKLYRWGTYLNGQGVLLTMTLGWCFFTAYVGTLLGLAPIVGAFAAGLVLEEATFRDWVGREVPLEDLLRPLTSFLVPVFFVHMGMKVQLDAFGDLKVLGFATVLTLAAIAGKQICSLGVLEKGLNRLAVGVGMIPRGEVGLIVAGIGATMKASDGEPIISGPTFSATVIMVMITTMITPPLLAIVFREKKGKAASPPVAAD
ncbi:MAG: cation:proton antiporter [Candidatus Sumerlaeaceae bacterium]|nr:cation:proton antiporter [Candidatus Sumerlaeaceae bacterium]